MIKQTLKASLLATALCGSAAAMADSVYIDTQIDYLGQGTQTGDFSDFTITYNSVTTFTDATNDGFLNVGDTFVSGLTGEQTVTLFPAAGGNTAFPLAWDLSFNLVNVTGVFTSSGLVYTGGTIELFHSFDNDFTSPAGAFDNPDNLIASLDISSGNVLLGTVPFSGTVASVESGDVAGVELSDVLNFSSPDKSFQDWLSEEETIYWAFEQFSSSSFVDEFNAVVGAQAQSGGAYASVGGTYEFEPAEHSGRLTFSVPEPAPVALFGLALLGLGLAKRKKS